MHSLSIEKHLFRRGLSDPQVQRALEAVRDYVTAHVSDTISDREWWENFEVFFAKLTADLSSKQLVATEVAADTLLVHSGLQAWSLARAGLAVARQGQNSNSAS